jgi:hypothetical protein
MAMQWFGRSWAAPLNELEQVAVPLGRPCLFCWQPIQDSARGVVMASVHPDRSASREPAHLLCFLRNTLGHETAQRIYEQLP